MSNHPILNPSDALRYEAERRKMRPEDLRLPECLLATYGRREFEAAVKLVNGKLVEWWPYEGRLAGGKFGRRDIAASQLYVGSPAAVMILEELVAHGTKKIIEAGLAGGIDASLQPGDLIIVTQAFSDEGTSRHYYHAERTFKPSSKLTSLLIAVAKEVDNTSKASAIWTTDGVYRETKSKVAKYRRMGAMLVNMETSALFAVSTFRRVEAASIQVVSDVLLKKEWKPAFHLERVLKNRQAMLRIAANTLAKA